MKKRVELWVIKAQKPITKNKHKVEIMEETPKSNWVLTSKLASTAK